MSSEALETYKKLTKQGVPAALTSGVLIGGLFRQQVVPTVPLRPSKISTGGFGGALALGTWIIYDGDYKNGAGFISVWSLLYLAVNGKDLYRRGGYSKLASWLVLGNFLTYASEFLAASPTRPLGFDAPIPPSSASGGPSGFPPSSSGSPPVTTV